MHKVLITGITGFLGAQIAERLITHGFEVIGTRRTSSDTWRCTKFEDKIQWIDLNHLSEIENTSKEDTTLDIIHCAWIGVEATDRNDWWLQGKNIELLLQLLKLSENIKISKFVFLGSQAEYGAIDGKISEDQPVTPVNAYGSVKLACLEILKTYSKLNDINWLWLRVFSVFGEKENNNWLIPATIAAMRSKESMDFTEGKQKYAYLYIKDFSRIIQLLLESKAQSGIYNISSQKVIALRTLIENIRSAVNNEFKLNFGKIPYRNNQSMHIEGNIEKLIQAIGPIQFTDFNVALSNTIKYYTSQK